MTTHANHGDAPPTVYLPITHCREVDSDQAHLAMSKWLTVMSHMWPSATITFVCTASEGKLSIGWRVDHSNHEEANTCVEAIRLATEATSPWLGVGQPATTCPWEAVPPSYYFTTVPIAAGEPHTTRALAWPAAAASDHTWQLSLTLHSLAAAPTSDKHFHHPDFDQWNGWSDHDHASSDVGSFTGMPVTMTLGTTSSGGGAVTALVAADTRGSQGLEPNPVRMAQAPVITHMQPDLLAHLLSTPARVPALLPAHPPSTPGSLFAYLADTASDHRLVFGASGQGKTSVLAHLGAQAAAEGRFVVTVDTHDGRLVRALAAEEWRLGRDPLVVRLVDPDLTHGPFPSLDLLRVPPGVTPGAWADALWILSRWVVWAEMTTREIGKVGERAGRGLFQVSVMDPARGTTLEDWPALLDPSDDALADLLERIGDARLTRLFRREIMPMITSPHADNAAIWIISLVEPVIGNPATAAVLAHPEYAIPLEEAIEAGRSVLIHAPASVLGDAGASLISAAVMYRASLAVRRKPAASGALFIADEFTRHPAAIYERDIAEIRKFGVGYVLATQSPHQMSTRLREVVLANAGAVMTFRAGPRDSALLDDLFPSVSARQLQTLGRHHLALTTFETDAVVQAPAPLPVPDHVDTWIPKRDAVPPVTDLHPDPDQYRSPVGSADLPSRTQSAASAESRTP